MGKFKDDLEKGLAMELKIIELLKEKGINTIKNPNERGMDLIIVEKGIEVKFDITAYKYGNFYIEFECNGKPSGVMSEDEVSLKYWCHTDGIDVFLLEGSMFKAWVAQKVIDCRGNSSNTSRGFRVVEAGGDGGRSKGLLVPMQKLKDIADFKYRLEEAIDEQTI